MDAAAGYGGGQAGMTGAVTAGTAGGAGEGAAGAVGSSDGSTTMDGSREEPEADDASDVPATTDAGEDTGADAVATVDTALDSVTTPEAGKDAEVLHFDGSCTGFATDVCMDNYNRGLGESFHLMNLCLTDKGTWDAVNLCRSSGKVGGCRTFESIEWYYSSASAATGMTDCAMFGGTWLQP